MSAQEDDLNDGAEVHGINPDAVISAIKERAARRKRGDFESDGRKIGLVVEGGGMRAAVSAGGMVALGHLGLAEIFDEAYATSAGVMNTSYFLSDQVDMGITVYFEDLATRRFINPLRFWKMLDVDHVMADVIPGTKPLEIQRILDSPTGFFVAVIDKTTGHGELVDVKGAEEGVNAALKAALSIPVLYNRTVSIGGRPCMDGGLRIPFPLQNAIDSGCTDILVLLSRPSDYVSLAPPWHKRLLFDLICSRGNRGVSRAYADHHQPAKTARDLAFGRLEPQPPVNIATFCTEVSEGFIDRTTADPALLRKAAISYGRRTLRTFGMPREEWDLGPSEGLSLTSRG